MVEDVDGEIILFHDSFVLRQRYAEDEHNVTLTVPMFEPVPPNYYVSVVSERWLNSETRLPISFKHLILPAKFPPPTPLLNLHALPPTALHNPEFERIYSSSIQSFNKIQIQVFQALYTTDGNVFVGAPARRRQRNNGGWNGKGRSMTMRRDRKSSSASKRRRGPDGHLQVGINCTL